jgi:hypothetical protein
MEFAMPPAGGEDMHELLIFSIGVGVGMVLMIALATVSVIFGERRYNAKRNKIG